MQREPVESTTVRSVGYESHSKVLEIEFQSGEIYQYLDVPEAVHRKFRRAGSKGRYFNDEIRDDYAFVRLGRGRRVAGG
jgi:hypothetical protein